MLAIIQVLMGWQFPERSMHRAVWCHAVSGFHPKHPALPADRGECSVPQVQHHDFLLELIVLELWVSEPPFGGIF